MAESIGIPTRFQISMNDTTWKIATIRFSVVERRMASALEESSSKSKRKGQRK